MTNYTLFIARSITTIIMYASHFVVCARVCVLKCAGIVVERLAESHLASRCTILDHVSPIPGKETYPGGALFPSHPRDFRSQWICDFSLPLSTTLIPH
jgi:hypothetical protein